MFSLLGVLAMERVCTVVVFVILTWCFNIQGQEQQGIKERYMSLVFIFKRAVFNTV